MGTGIIMNSSYLHVKNGTSIKLPAYDSKISGNTFISVEKCQANLNTVAGTIDESIADRCFTHTLDSTHFIVFPIESTIKIFEVQADGTATIIAQSSQQFADSTNVIKISDNVFVSYTTGESYLTFYEIGDDYTIGRYRVSVSATHQVSCYSTNMILVTTSSSSSSNTSTVYSWDTSTHKITTVTTLDNKWRYCAGHFAENLTFLVAYASGSKTQKIIVGTVDSAGKFTQKGSSGTFEGDSSIYVIGTMVQTASNEFAFFYDENVLFITLAADYSLSIKKFIYSNLGGDMSDGENSIFYNESDGYIYSGQLYKISPTDYTYELYPMKYNIRNHGYGRFGNILYDIYGYTIYRHDLRATQPCVRDSLETSVISGLTITSCSSNAPGKVTLLADNTAALSSYGIAQNVVDQIVDDSIDTIQQEVTK